ncbi:MAG: nucleotidyltransferase domain-containing protein, partial [Nanoarchaeota archaeon]|nr:nucleotidyltransferase domain-containing protein [Nanoarchaeota archaeon]
MKNLEIAKILDNIADILELQGIEFKPRAYRNAARGVENLAEDIKELYEKGKLEEIPGVGKHIAEKISEYIKTGRLKYYNQLKKKIKVNLEELNLIPGMGPKKIKFLYEKLKIKNIKDLEKAIKKKKLQKLKGFGESTEQDFLRGIQFVKSRPKRFLYAHLEPIVKEITKQFSKYPFVKKIEIAGSFRRGKETIGDLDFLVVSNEPGKVMKLFTALPDIKRVLAKGTTK